jgi:hypothetical protein
MKILLILPDGVGIRNFFCTDFVQRLVREGPVEVWHAIPAEVLTTYVGKWASEIRWTRFPPIREYPWERLLRQAKLIAQLCWKRHPASDYMLKQLKPGGRLPNWALGRAAHALGRAMGNRRGVVWLDRAHARVVGAARQTRLIEKSLAQKHLDVVFCTHQRASLAVPVMVAARSLGIPTVNFIYSWDNLPKGRMATHCDYFLVWSELMKGELLHYYPEVPEQRTLIVGTPQFEHYFNPALLESRETFLGRFGLSTNRPVVCFSGDDLSTSPHDPAYLRDLAEALRTYPVESRPQLIFRRCPADTSDRYRKVLEACPEIVSAEPLWHRPTNGDWAHAVPDPADVTMLVNLVRHCDLVVNLGSTMAMDFAIFNKPAIFVRYNPVVDSARWDVEQVYQLPHFETVHRLQPVYWAKSKGQLPALVKRALTEPDELSGARTAWLETIACHPLNAASARCVEALRSITSRGKAGCTSSS